MDRDVFLCHASEDKAGVIRPIASALDAASISYWLDEAEIAWGDSIVQKVNDGLSSARYVIVVLSEHSILKHWPLRELNASLNIEASNGVVKVLPLLVGTLDVRRAILAKMPLLNDKRYLSWSGNSDEIVDELASKLGRDGKASGEEKSARVTLPKLKKRITDRDRNKFLTTAFDEIRSYFNVAIKELQRHSSDYDGEVTEIGRHKFVCRLYRDGDEVAACKIWIGGLTRSDSICYFSGHFEFDNDNSCNEILNIVEDDGELGLKPSLKLWGGIAKLMNSEASAEYLWRELCSPLER